METIKIGDIEIYNKGKINIIHSRLMHPTEFLRTAFRYMEGGTNSNYLARHMHESLKVPKFYCKAGGCIRVSEVDYYYNYPISTIMALHCMLAAKKQITHYMAFSTHTDNSVVIEMTGPIDDLYVFVGMLRCNSDITDLKKIWYSNINLNEIISYVSHIDVLRAYITPLNTCAFLGKCVHKKYQKIACPRGFVDPIEEAKVALLPPQAEEVKVAPLSPQAEEAKVALLPPQAEEVKVAPLPPPVEEATSPPQAGDMLAQLAHLAQLAQPIVSDDTKPKKRKIGAGGTGVLKKKKKKKLADAAKL